VIVKTLSFPIALFFSLLDLLVDYVNYGIKRAGRFVSAMDLARETNGASMGMILLSGLCPILFYFLLPRLF
jgi:hypothetical protein